MGTTHSGDETCGTVLKDEVENFGVCTIMMSDRVKVYTIVKKAEESAVAAAVQEEPCGALKVYIFRDSECKNADAELTKEWQNFYDNLPTGKCNDQGSDAG